MQEIFVALFVGLILGWLIEWLIDWRYWRPTVAALRQENERLRSQIEAASSPVQSPSSTQPSMHTGAEGK